MALSIAVPAIALVVLLVGNRSFAEPNVSVRATSGNLAPDNSKQGKAILTATNMKPGDVSTGTVSIRNSAAVSASLSLATADRKERPGPNGGRLADRLFVVIADLSRRSRPATVYRGPIGAMPDRNLGVWAPREVRTYSFAVTFSPGGREDNAYMSSGMSLSYRWTARVARQAPLRLGVRPVREDQLGRRRIGVLARCARSCTVTARGRLQARPGGRAVRIAGLRLVRRRLPANRSTRVYLRLDRAALNAVRRWQRRRQRVEAIVVVEAAGAPADRRVVRIAVAAPRR